MRIHLSRNNTQRLFSSLAEKRWTLTKLAQRFKVSRRTVFDWRRGISTLPEGVYTRLLKISALKGAIVVSKTTPDFWHTAMAGKKGARARLKLYGNFGTPDGRKRGGEISYRHHETRRTLFYNVKEIMRPRNSDAFAEFLGIMCGDGHLSHYQAMVTTNSITDRHHARFVQRQFQKLFGIHGALHYKRHEHAINIVASSKKLAIFLEKKGMPIGNKIQNKISAPGWIMKNSSYQVAFLRGLFDTDGSIYLDRHSIRGRVYERMGWSISSCADTLLQGMLLILIRLGFSPTSTRQRAVFMRRENDIHRYFREIGSHNPKHVKRYLHYVARKGAPNGKAPVSKTGTP